MPFTEYEPKERPSLLNSDTLHNLYLNHVSDSRLIRSFSDITESRNYKQQVEANLQAF